MTDQHPQYENDRKLGYSMSLNDMDVDWLASEVRMLHVQVETAKRERQHAEERTRRLLADWRHVLAHQLDGRRFAWHLGKYATIGACKAIDEVYPISRCAADCEFRP